MTVKAWKVIGRCLLVLLCVVLVIAIVGIAQFFHRSDPKNVKRYDTDNPFITGETAISAHRSGAGDYPEETLAAFRGCVEDPDFAVDYFEFDLHMTADDILVLSHDATLDRVSDAAAVFGAENVLVRDKTLSELKQLNMAAQFVTDEGEAPYAGLHGEAVPDELVQGLERVVVTGTPVRGDFFLQTKVEARQKLGFTDDKPVVVTSWGSLGALVMNQHMVDFVARECREGQPFHHIYGVGQRYYSRVLEALKERGIDLADYPDVDVREYIYDMPLVMAAADVVLCRAGASTISELTAIAKPSILVPSPNVTANHQEKNARVLADQGAAVLLLERDCVENTLYDAADHLLRDRRRRDDMVRALTAMAVPDAGEKIYWTLRALMK